MSDEINFISSVGRPGNWTQHMFFFYFALKYDVKSSVGFSKNIPKNIINESKMDKSSHSLISSDLIGLCAFIIILIEIFLNDFSMKI